MQRKKWKTHPCMTKPRKDGAPGYDRCFGDVVGRRYYFFFFGLVRALLIEALSAILGK
jgi:hypothetical protein